MRTTWCPIAIVNNSPLAKSAGHNFALALRNDHEAWWDLPFLDEKLTICIGFWNYIDSNGHEMAGLNVGKNGDALEHGNCVAQLVLAQWRVVGTASARCCWSPLSSVFVGLQQALAQLRSNN